MGVRAVRIRIIVESGEAKQPGNRLSWFRQSLASWLAIAMGLAVLVFHALASAQTSSLQSRGLYRKLKPVPALVVSPSPHLAPLPDAPPGAPPVPPTAPLTLAMARLAPPLARTPEQMPASPPEVSWDGKLLSITCENSTLADILTAVRVHTGAAIEIPPSAAAERIATNLGPAPPRQVLTTLLSSSDFDYVIQASEDNKDWLGSVILTPRGKADGEIADVAVLPASGVRRTPSYSNSGQRTPEVPRGPVAENSASREAASTSGAAELNRQANSAGAESTPANVQVPTSANSQVVPLDPAPADGGGSHGAGDRSSAPQPVAPPVSGMGATQPASIPQTVQDLQRMYQQRREIQAQRNQPSSAPAN